MMSKIKVVWICGFSNEETRKRIKTKIPWLIKKIYTRRGRPMQDTLTDYAIWNTNALAEIKKFPQIELHVICPERYMVEKTVDYETEGVFYHFFRDQHSDSLSWLLYQTIFKYSYRFKRNRKHVKELIDAIKPQVVHLIGAENPYYSTSILDVPKNICTIVQLQALLCSIENSEMFSKTRQHDFHVKGMLEKQIISNADFIGTNVSAFRNNIVNSINSNVKFLSISLAAAEAVDLSSRDTKYDFVYFASDISKSCDDAIETFALALKQNPSITLDVVGGYNDEFKSVLDKRINELGIESSVTFEGRLPTHSDVIDQIKKSRYALLPLKKDVVPSTIREAMASGLPILTTVTEGTPLLNKDAECVLLSEYMDYANMASNMLKLIDNKELAENLRQNAATYMRNNYNNYDIISKWVECYQACVRYKQNGETIPSKLSC